MPVFIIKEKRWEGFGEEDRTSGAGPAANEATLFGLANGLTNLRKSLLKVLLLRSSPGTVVRGGRGALGLNMIVCVLKGGACWTEGN